MPGISPYFCLDVFLYCIYIVHLRKNTPVEKLIRSFNQTNAGTRDAKTAKEFIATLMAVTLQSIIIIQKTVSLSALLKVSIMEQHGMKMTRNVPV